MSGIVAFVVVSIIGAILGVLGLRQTRGRGPFRQISDVERERREIRAILKGTETPRPSNPPRPSFVADRTVRFACAECGELTASNELEEVKGRKVCATCREGLAEEDASGTYRE